ncbi:MAG: T9SS type A sorting domain-containing protein [Flavobacteriales bacterium]|nr:T9SS type A sorting domain-containing protein [Flavobacteriales bacterium]
MRYLPLIAALCIGPGALAQTGPGGVGTSANNVLWLSADNSATVAGTAVTNWTDRSGNGNNAASPSVATRPTWVGSALNGHPMISFDGVDDEMRIPDAGSLDMNQWDIFFVSAENTAKSNNAWLAKGTSTQPNYALWSPNDGAMLMPIFDILNLLSSPAAPVGTTSSSFSLLEYTNTVIFFLFPSRTAYKAGTTIYSDASLLQLPANNANPLYLGNVQGTTGWNMDGDLAEVIIYDSPVNSTQRIIVNNYLSAKYALPLSANNIYVQDDPANGDYDHEMAGIGRTGLTNQHTDARGGVVQINNATGLGNNEFLLWGHDNAALHAIGSTDFPAGLQGRWHRVWRVNEVNAAGGAVDVGNVNITFDLTGQGPVTASDLRLLVDLNNNGVFADDAPVAIAASSVGGNLYRFAGVNALVNDRRFTLGTINLVQTSLPVELLNFEADVREDRTVHLTWATASEQNNDHFTVQRSTEGSDWIDVTTVPGAGTSLTMLEYSALDPQPRAGLNYYRLQQTDHDGHSTLSDVVSVHIGRAEEELLVYPVPAQDLVNVVFRSKGQNGIRLLNDRGQQIGAPITATANGAVIDVSHLPIGTYLVAVVSESGTLTRRLIVSR